MYIIIEIQKAQDGTVSTLVTTKDTRNEADSTFHSILAAAAISKLSSHAAVLMTEDGNPLRNESYHHETEAEEAET